MATDRRSLGHDDIIADDAVVRDVAITHNKTIIADRSDSSAPCCASVQCGVFAYDVVITDDQARRFTLVREILRGPAQAGEWEDSVALSQFGMTLDENVRDQTRTLAESHIGTDDAAWANFNIVIQLDGRIDNGGGVNFCAHWITRDDRPSWLRIRNLWRARR